jgi:hypothetical protein
MLLCVQANSTAHQSLSARQTQALHQLVHARGKIQRNTPNKLMEIGHEQRLHPGIGHVRRK